MSKKLYGLLPLLAVAAFMVVPGVASALQWYSTNLKTNVTELIGDFPGVEVETLGELILTDRTIAAPLEIDVKCHVEDTGNVWNHNGAGEDLVLTFEEDGNFNPACEGILLFEGSPVGGCEKASFEAKNLPWGSELLTEDDEIVDDINGIEVKVALVNCELGVGSAELTYSGSLHPKFVNGTSASSPSFAEFSEASGSLESDAKTQGFISGDDFVKGPAGDELITAG